MAVDSLLQVAGFPCCEHCSGEDHDWHDDGCWFGCNDTRAELLNRQAALIDESRTKVEALEQALVAERTERVKAQELVTRLSEAHAWQTAWGEQDCHDLVWASMLGEEYGQVCRAANEATFSSGSTRGDYTVLRAELEQVAAVAVAWAEAIDRRGGTT